MRKIIPFRKEILFKTKIKEVTSISLEHDYKVDDNLISGEFVVSGDYKITSSSINREEFNYTIPFEIDLDNKYDIGSISLDIENFYYEVMDEEVLKVSIDVLVEGEYKTELVEETERKIEELPEVMEFDDNERDNDDEIIDIDVENENINDNKNINLFNNVNMEDTYATYHVYIVKENDTIDDILNKYNVSREELENYNDISSIKYKDKLIIPSKNE